MSFLKSLLADKPYVCPICERGFKASITLQNHLNAHTGNKPHKCNECEACFATYGDLSRHFKYKHTNDRPHKCPACEYKCVELSKLKRHIRCHTGERPYQCPHCTYASTDTFKLKRHIRIHTGEKPYECDICHKRFNQQNSMKAHRNIHAENNRPVYQCELCPTTCVEKKYLRLHVEKFHMSNVPIPCKMCGKTFPDKYTLKVHKKSHMGEKCFKCELCPFSSISQIQLKSHMLTHTDLKPFQCDKCYLSFRQKVALKKHQILHENPDYAPPILKQENHDCQQCGVNFRSKVNLAAHMALHDSNSTIQNKVKALQIGSQKLIQIVDGKNVEVIDDDNTEEVLSMENVQIQDEEGQQYLVLEVAHLPDEGNGAGYGVVQVARDQGNVFAEKITMMQKLSLCENENDDIESDIQEAEKESQPKLEFIKEVQVVKHEVSPLESKQITRMRKELDLATCFGFEDD